MDLIFLRQEIDKAAHDVDSRKENIARYERSEKEVESEMKGIDEEMDRLKNRREKVYKHLSTVTAMIYVEKGKYKSALIDFYRAWQDYQKGKAGSQPIP